jgi:hypothetical protein
MRSGGLAFADGLHVNHAMSRFASLLLLFVAVLLGSCQDETRTGYISLAGRLFVFNPRLATATAVITVNVLKPVPEGSSIVLAFENPAGGAALVMQQIIREKQSRVDFETEPLLCIRKGKRYGFTLTLQDAKQKTLQKIESSLESTLDQSVLPDAPLVEGPGYEPNPALKNDDAGRALRKRAAACPQ